MMDSTLDSILLALETSAALGSVALLRATSTGIQVTSLEHEGAQTHTERLLPMAHQLLKEAGLTPADLQVVAFGQGPGAFTGLRVACSVAQGIALAQALPVVAVESLQAVAAQTAVQPNQAIVVALDARMAEVYLAVYRRLAGPGDEIAWEQLQVPILIGAAQVVPWVAGHLAQWGIDPAVLPLLLGGDAWGIYAEQMTPNPAALPGWVRHDSLRPHAREIARLAYQAWRRGDTIPPEQALPLYVRERVAYTTKERLAGYGGNPRASTLMAAAEPVPASAGLVSRVPGNPLGAVVGPVNRGLDAKITALQADDLDVLVGIEASVQAFPWTRGNFADALAAGYDTGVLRKAGQIMGFCVLMHAPDVSHVLVITVEKSWQRQGCGSRLLNWCMERACAQGTGGLILEVRPSNQIAIAFYARYGFTHIGVRRGYYAAACGQREDAWVMQKNGVETRANDG
jgi:tRNA threonylcarbamoyladenosine biosynthesis protein TsaB